MQPIIEFVSSFDTPENLKRILEFLKDDFLNQYSEEKFRPIRIEFSPYISNRLYEIAKRRGITPTEALEHLVKEDLEIMEKAEEKFKKLEACAKDKSKDEET